MKDYSMNIARDGFSLGLLVFVLVTFSSIKSNGYMCWSEPNNFIFYTELFIFFIGGFLIISSILKNFIKKSKEVRKNEI